MITLATLNKATAQEVFDQVATHLLTQNRKSIGSMECLYRSEIGKCAAGCLISDDEYDPKFEGKSWHGLITFHNIPNKHKELIERLQVVHDNFIPIEWRNVLIKIGEKECLNVDKVLEFKN